MTGVTGYIGSRLALRLVEDGCHVHAVTREGGRPLPDVLQSRVHELRHSGDTESLCSQLAGRSIDVAIHLASLFIAEHRPDQVSALVNSNLLFSTQFVEACVQADISAFINTGTAWQHYRSTAYDPVCLYAATKQAFEDILDYYSDAHALRSITLKLFDTYGPHDPRRKLVSLLIDAIGTGQPMALSPGQQEIDLVHVDDVIAAYCQSIQLLLSPNSEMGHRRYALSGGEPLSIQSLADLISRISGNTAELTWGARPYRRREVMRAVRNLPALPSWAPRHTLESGLRTIMDAV